MASYYGKVESRLVEDLAAKAAERSEEPSKLVIDLETKRNENMLALGVSQLVKDLADKQAIEKMFLSKWKEADESSKEEIETLVLEALGHPLDISKLVLDLEEKTAEKVLANDVDNASIPTTE